MDDTDLHHPHEGQTTKVRFFSTARETQKAVSWDSGTVKMKRKILRTFDENYFTQGWKAASFFWHHISKEDKQALYLFFQKSEAFGAVVRGVCSAIDHVCLWFQTPVKTLQVSISVLVPLISSQMSERSAKTSKDSCFSWTIAASLLTFSEARTSFGSTFLWGIQLQFCWISLSWDRLL